MLRAGLLAAIAAMVLATSAEAQNQTRTTTCKRNYGGGGETCTTTSMDLPGLTPAIQRLSSKEVSEQTDRIAKWEEACKPKVSHDSYGVARYSYAHPHCEYGLTGQ